MVSITSLIGLPDNHPDLHQHGRFLNKLDYYPVIDPKTGLVIDIVHKRIYSRIYSQTGFRFYYRYDSIKNLCTNNSKSFPVESFDVARHFDESGDCDYRYVIFCNQDD